MTTDTRKQIAHHHHSEDGLRRARNASTPQALPARPTASPSDATTGTASSQIQEVPNSETHRLPRKKNATKATGRVKRPITRSTPSEISVSACIGAAIDAWLTTSSITDFHIAGQWLFLM